MKKLLCLCLVLVLSMSLMVGCGNNNENPVETNKGASENAPDISKEPEVKDDPLSDTPNSDDAKVSDNNEKPVVYIIVKGGTKDSSICYHLEGCSELKQAEEQVMQWEMVQALGFRQCPTCKPPKYEGYIE